MWTRAGAGGKTVGRVLKASEAVKVRGEVEAYHGFRKIVDEIVAVNEEICEARPVAAAAAVGPPGGGGVDGLAGSDGEKGGSGSGSGRSSRRRSRPRPTG